MNIIVACVIVASFIIVACLIVGYIFRHCISVLQQTMFFSFSKLIIGLFFIIMLLRSGTVKAGNIRRCDSKKCKLCSEAKLLINNETFNYLKNDTHINQDNFVCTSKNLVYVLCCSEENCSFQYIGKTKQTLRARYNGHRSSLRTKKGCQLVIEHFTKTHQPSNLHIRPIDADCRKEMSYIRNFGTLFPYGGNDRLEEPKFIDAKERFYNGDCIWQLFEHQKSSRGKRGGKNLRSSSSNPPQPTTIPSILDKIVDIKSQGGNFKLTARNLINKCQKQTVVELLDFVNNMEDDHDIRFILIDLARHYMVRCQKPESKLTKPKDFIVFKYTNRYIENLGLSALCNKTSYPCNNIELTPTFSYSKPIRSSVLNYAKSVLKDDDVIPDSCDCITSEFCDQNLRHMEAVTYYASIFLVILYPLPPLSASVSIGIPPPPADVSIAQPALILKTNFGSIIYQAMKTRIERS